MNSVSISTRAARAHFSKYRWHSTCAGPYPRNFGCNSALNKIASLSRVNDFIATYLAQVTVALYWSAGVQCSLHQLPFWLSCWPRRNVSQALIRALCDDMNAAPNSFMDCKNRPTSSNSFKRIAWWMYIPLNMNRISLSKYVEFSCKTPKSLITSKNPNIIRNLSRRGDFHERECI